MSRPPATQYSIVLRVTLDNVPGVLGRLATAIGEAGGNIFAVDAFEAKGAIVDREIVVNCSSVDHQAEVVEAVRGTSGITLHDWWDRTFRMHEGGKIEVLPLCPVGDQEDLSMAYTPGVARVCTAIARRRAPRRRVHDPPEHRGDRERRIGRARPGRHRSEGCDAGHGGQGTVVQGVRWCRRVPDLSRRVVAGGDHRDGGAARPDVRRHQPRGHRGSGCVPGRRGAQGAARHPGVPRRPARHSGRHARGRSRTPCGSPASEWPTSRS